MSIEMQQSDFTEVMEIPKGASPLPENGLMQTRSPYSTAVAVIRPRVLAIVESKCLEEAAIAGDDFYYSWSQGGQVTEGLTVGAALAIARNMGNNAVDVEVRETPQAWYFTGAYIDLETGFNIRRTFRQNKQSPRKKDGKEIYSGERGQDIIYQIGQSKAIRNVVLNAAPSWLGRKVFEKAKENVVAKIEKMGPEKAKTLLIQKMTNLGIPTDRVVAVFGQPGTWDVEKLVRIGGAVRSIEDGRERLDDVFPSPAGSGPASDIATKAKEALQKQTLKNGNGGKPKPTEGAPVEGEAAPEQRQAESDPVKDFGVKQTNEILARIEKAATVEALSKIHADIVTGMDIGEFSETQADSIRLAWNARHAQVAPKTEGAGK